MRLQAVHTSANTVFPARRLLLGLFPALLLACAAIVAVAQDSVHTPPYTTIVVFGDSLSDTGNFAHLTQAKYGVRIPGPIADYTDGRFTDGADTEPAAQDFFGLWIEQFAAMLPSKPVIKDSLDGGTNYAYGFATTGNGTGMVNFGPENSLFINVDNIGQQITDYLGTRPKINGKVLFVVWGGAIDVLDATSSNEVIAAAIQEGLDIQRLIDAGATQFIIPNLPPLGAIPRLNGSPVASAAATQASVLYNDVLAQALAILRDFNRGKHLTFFQVDVFALFNQIVASPAAFSLEDVTDSSQGVPVDPDTFLFWDDLHPTTRGHNILAITVDGVVDPRDCRSPVVDHCESVSANAGGH